mmetsp:Transcript_10848/g.16678  ORF Transcript_10848/g.16678 Transcript_10848/m.16678 type:complete len:714 (+) Transcript_10848:79-2220(+)
MPLVESVRNYFTFSDASSSRLSVVSTESGKEKPPSLKQRTSSVDTRSDFRGDTWLSLRDLVKIQELFCSVNNFPIWRRHLTWAMDDGKELKSYMTGRYSSSMIFLSLLLGAELNVMFNSSPITTQVRHSLSSEDLSLSFWIGLAILGSTMLTLLSLITTFTAWSMVGAISDTNAHCILRSSIGQYVLELPQQFMVGSIYCFLIWLTLFFFKLMNSGILSCGLFIIVYTLLFHIITTFSAFGRLILHTTAMSKQRIFESNFERGMTPPALQEELHKRAKAELMNGTSIKRQYEKAVVPVNSNLSPEGLQEHLKRSRMPRAAVDGAVTPSSMSRSVSTSGGNRKRGDSWVRFATDINNSNKASTPTSRDLLTPTVELSSSMASSRTSSRESSAGNSSNDLNVDTSMVLPPPPPSEVGTPGGFASVGSLNAWLASSTEMTVTPVISKSERKRISKDFSEITDTTPWSETPIKRTSTTYQPENSVGDESTIDSQGSQIRQEIEARFQSLNETGNTSTDYTIPLDNILMDSDYQSNNESLDLTHVLGPDLPIISTTQTSSLVLPQPIPLQKRSISSTHTKTGTVHGAALSPTAPASYIAPSSSQKNRPQTPAIESFQDFSKSDSSLTPSPGRPLKPDESDKNSSFRNQHKNAYTIENNNASYQGQTASTQAPSNRSRIDDDKKKQSTPSVRTPSENQQLLVDQYHHQNYSSTSFSDNV